MRFTRRGCLPQVHDEKLTRIYALTMSDDAAGNGAQPCRHTDRA